MVYVLVVCCRWPIDAISRRNGASGRETWKPSTHSRFVHFVVMYSLSISIRRFCCEEEEVIHDYDKVSGERLDEFD